MALVVPLKLSCHMKQFFCVIKVMKSVRIEGSQKVTDFSFRARFPFCNFRVPR